MKILDLLYLNLDILAKLAKEWNQVFFMEHEVKLWWPLPAAGGGFGSQDFTIVKVQGNGENTLLSVVSGEKEIDPGATGLVFTNMLAKAIMYQVYIEMHSGAKITLAASRKYCWIVAGKRLSDQVVTSCLPCRIQQAKRVIPSCQMCLKTGSSHQIYLLMFKLTFVVQLVL